MFNCNSYTLIKYKICDNILKTLSPRTFPITSNLFCWQLEILRATFEFREIGRQFNEYREVRKKKNRKLKMKSKLIIFSSDICI